MASVAPQLIEEVTGHAQSDSIEDAREICTDILTFGITYVYIVFPLALQSNAGHGLLILEFSRSRTTTYHSR